MVTYSCHSNQSSYPTGTKNNLFVPLAYSEDAICEIWQESASWLQRKCHLKMLTMTMTTTDGRTDKGYLPIL